MVSRRLSRESGHRRKFLAIVDDTPECERAITYAARRAQTTGGLLVLLFVIVPEGFGEWMGVGDIMRQEALTAANLALDAAQARLSADGGVESERVIREGKPAEAILELIEDDQDIAIMVLAASTAKDGPGPLVASIGRGAAFPIPVTIVPQTLTDEDIAAIT